MVLSLLSWPCEKSIYFLDYVAITYDFDKKYFVLKVRGSKKVKGFHCYQIKFGPKTSLPPTAQVYITIMSRKILYKNFDIIHFPSICRNAVPKK